MTSPAQYSERLTEELSSVISDSQFYLEDVTVRSAGRRLLVQVVIDADGPLDLDEVARLSRQIDLHIEEFGLLDDVAFTLEVTSPGVDRPLTLPRHWRNNIGRKVHVVLSDDSVFEDRIESVSHDSVTFETRGAMALAEITQGLVQIEFNRPRTNAGASENEDALMDEES